MAYKFPWTNYHELNLDWILDTVKKLFAQTEQNNAIVTQYDGRLTEVELTADNAQTAAEQAQQNSTAALDLAQGAQTTATQAQQAAAQAQQAAGQAQTAAGQALEAAATAQQTATQAQQTAQNFDGRITQAENNAASALHAAQAFDEQVQGAITAANNANTAATTALTKATETERELAAQRSTLEGIVSDGVASLQETAQDATEEIKATGQTVLDSIPADYTTLSDLVDKKADVIYNTAAGDIASFNDGADDMKIKSLIVNIVPVQAGSGDPSPDNVRPISGHTECEVTRTGKNLFDKTATNTSNGYAENSLLTSEGAISSNGSVNISEYIKVSPSTDFVISGSVTSGMYSPSVCFYDILKNFISGVAYSNRATIAFTTPANAAYLRMSYNKNATDNYQLEVGSTASTYEPYTGEAISVTFPSEAGTVYGGTLDVISGRLISNYRYITIDGTNIRCTGGYGAAGPLYLPLVSISNYKSISPWTCYCDKLKSTSISAELQSTDNTISIGNAGNGIVLHIAGIQGTDGSQGYNSTQEVINAANTWLQSNPITVCYLLETDTQYDITPQEVKTLFQYNNIWSDAGTVDVEYPADTKTYIDNKFTELQALILEH